MRHNFGAHQKLFKYFKTSDHEEFFTRMSVKHLLSRTILMIISSKVIFSSVILSVH